MDYIDLHTHTHYSDGELSPNDLINKAYKKNISVIAITDHDTINGLKNIDYGYNDVIRVIKGIELSAKANKGRMHILGYNIDINNSFLNQKLKEIKDNNINYIIKLLAQINVDYNIKFSYADIKKLINSSHNINRVDVARLCVENGYADSVQDAFNMYLIDAYKKIGGNNKGFGYKECIDIILKSGGIPVLAHPKSLNLNDKELLDLLLDMKSVGLEGLECFHSTHTSEEVNLYLSLAQKVLLLVSGGSDYHGKYTKPNVNLGVVNGEKILSKKLTIMSKL